MKKRILEKSLEMFLQFGIRSVSMDDIAKEMGISKKTIYQHYVTKDKLVMAVINVQIKTMETDCDADFSNADDAIHELFLTLGKMNQHYSTTNPMVLYDLEKFYPLAFKKFKNHKSEYIYNKVENNLRKGIKQGIYRKEIKVDVLTKYRIETLTLPFNLSVFPPPEYNISEVASELILHFMYGVANQKGQLLIEKYLKEIKN